MLPEWEEAETELAGLGDGLTSSWRAGVGDDRCRRLRVGVQTEAGSWQLEAGSWQQTEHSHYR